METLTRLVTESLARHGLDRPLDYRRLQWSRWFRCESHHSLLSVPSKPGVFALAEEVVDFGSVSTHVGTATLGCPAGQSPAGTGPTPNVEERRFSAAEPSRSPKPEARGPFPEAESRRMLAVSQFFEDDDMAFVLDRMLSFQNPMRARLASGRYFVRYVVIEDASQRRSICAALNQWIVSSTEKVTGIGAHFATSLDITPAHVATTAHVVSSGHVETAASAVPRSRSGAASTAPPDNPQSPTITAPQLDSGAATNIHCPSPFPSGF